MTDPARKEIWLINLDPTMEREQAGTRPALVMSADIFNRGYSDLVFIILITSKAKNIRSHVPLLPPEGGLNLPSFITCEPMRSVSKQRLIKRLGGYLASDDGGSRRPVKNFAGFIKSFRVKSGKA